MTAVAVRQRGNPRGRFTAERRAAGCPLQGAHDMLERAGTDEAALALLFTPELPVVLPSFEPNPLASDATRAATGHVEVEFVITKYGRARAIQIRDATNAAHRARADLVDLMKSSRFRPRLTDGRCADSSPVVVRYGLYD
jgi:hypothetical protein